MADAAGQSVGECRRNVLLDVAKNPAGKPTDLALLSEVIALRMIVANVAYYLAAEGKVGAENMKAFTLSAPIAPS